MDKPKTITITLDGREIQAVPGKTVLQVANDNGIEIPTLCYDARLNPYGSCLICVVEIEGMPKLALSCATEIREGMKIRTTSDKIYTARKNSLSLLLSNHYADCRGNCYEKCPADVDVQGYLAFANAGQYLEALELIRATNPLPLVCGRVCVRYCEANCRRKNVDSAVGVNFVKRYVADLMHDKLPAPVVPAPNGKKVAVVGGGPAGLTAAYFLARKGYKVSIFDKESRLGGMVRWGIPDYRLPRETLDKEIDYILAHGVDARTNMKLGKDFSLDDLRNQGFQATFLALGAWVAKKMGIDAEETPGVWGGINFLERVKKEGPPDLSGHVLVVGGGNTAIDAARTALRCKASKVSIIYRRTRDEMPADDIEIEDAVHEGVELRFLLAPVRVVAKDGRVSGLICQDMKLGEPDAKGRRRPVPVPGSEKEIPCSWIIAAIGQDCDLSGIGKSSAGELTISKWNTILADEHSFATNLPGVFAGGDVLTGPAAAIDAIGAGRKVATVIDRYLSTGKVLPGPTEFLSKKTNFGELPESFFETLKKIERSQMRQEKAKERVASFEEVDLGVAPKDVPHESGRCLTCGCSAVFTCDLKKYAGDYGVDQKKFPGKTKKYEVDDRHPGIALDPNKCILCGKCVRLCSELVGASALGYVNRGFDTVIRPSMEKPLQETTCVSCGNCIEICPTGSIDYRWPLEKPGPWITRASESVCNHCSVGCRIVFNKSSEKLWYVTSRKEPDGTPSQICYRGRFGHEFLASGKRVLMPRIPQEKGFKEISLEEAIEKTVKGLGTVVEKHGPGALAVLVSPSATNEEIFLAQKLSEVFKSRNISSLALFDLAESLAGLERTFGIAASTVTRERLAQADQVVLVGNGLDDENPVLGMNVRQALRGGARLVYLGESDSRLARSADLVLQTGNILPVLQTLAREIASLPGFDEKKVSGRAEGLDSYLGANQVTLEKVEKLTGLEPRKLSGLAHVLADPTKKTVFIASPDSNPANHRVLEAIAHILLLMNGEGAGDGRVGNGLLIASGFSNLQGLIDLVGNRVPEGLPEALADGRIRGLIAIGEDPLGVKKFAKLRGKLEFLATIDVLESATTRKADVVLPGSPFAETAGTITSFDRTFRAFAPAFDPVCGKSGWQILASLVAMASGKKPLNLMEARWGMSDSAKEYKPLERLGGDGEFKKTETAGAPDLFSGGFPTPSEKATIVFTPAPAKKGKKPVASLGSGTPLQASLEPLRKKLFPER